VNVLASGSADVHFVHPDEFRGWVRDRKSREVAQKLMTARDAVAAFVPDGAYVAYDFSSLTRGPQAVVREIIRQRKKRLWTCAEFTLAESSLLAGAGCIARIDVGFLGYGDYISRKVAEGQVAVYEWTNGTLAARILAGARGIPFLPVRSLLATDGLRYSGAKVVQDPFTGDPVCLVPALNPDVALIHAHQADATGNTRIYGTTLFAFEAAMASRRVIVSAEEIIDPLEFRKDPQRTTLPHFLVDAVVHAPFGAYPGGVPGRYELDVEHINRINEIETDEAMRDYLEEMVYSVADHDEFLEKRVGWKRLTALAARATIREGFV